MISPDEIKKKASNRYRECLKTWLEHGTLDSLFPLPIRFRHVKTGDDFSATLAGIRALREESKEAKGHGYAIAWREIRSTQFGRNAFPDRISFETPEDYLGFIGKEKAFAAFQSSVGAIRRAFPVLEPWLRSNLKLTCDLAEAGITDGLLKVCAYLAAHSRPGLFARELPVEVDTKFVERHATKILRPWLDLILPPESIRADEPHFERRFGLGYPEPLIRMRFLDSDLGAGHGFRQSEIALPLSAAARAIEIGVQPPVIFVVENLVNALTLPDRKNAMVLAGLGNFVNLFRYLSWLHRCPDLYYWGDIDVQGFEILSQFRSWFPQTVSVLMDEATADEFVHFRVEGVPRRSDRPLYLTGDERALFEKCHGNNWRLEQEKISQTWVTEKLLMDSDADNPLRRI